MWFEGEWQVIVGIPKNHFIYNINVHIKCERITNMLISIIQFFKELKNKLNLFKNEIVFTSKGEIKITLNITNKLDI